MSIRTKQEVTLLLKNLKQGDKSTQDEIMKILYHDLRNFAGNILSKENQTITFQATELVNEVYIRMFNSEQLDWTDRTHFLSAAIVVMRRFLVDHARKKRANTRIPKSIIDPLEDSLSDLQSFDSDVILLDDALSDLEKLDERQAQIVEYRFFGGLTETEIAKILNVSISTINREWKSAKLWLMHQIRNA
jgi:RNA polymerase sigma factor (TIGR02999 family)